jgi:hypothetical protein
MKRVLKSERRPVESKGKYVYCVIKKSQDENFSLGETGFEDGEVAAFEYKDLTPIVSDATFREYGVNEEDIDLHRRVVAAVMEEHSVLPVAYGMIFKNRKLLTVAMGAGYAAMKKAFDIVDGKVELGLKVLVPKDAEVDKAAYRSSFLEGLRGIAFDFKDLKLFSDRLVLNSAFLVERSKMDEFSEKVGELISDHGEVKIQYSGPWPAYNFVDIHILGNHGKGRR